MGNCKKRIRQNTPNISSPFLSSYSLIGKPIQCPKCGYNFPARTSYETFNFHLDLCLTNHNFAGAHPNNFENTIKKNKELFLWQEKEDGEWQLDKYEIDNNKLQFLKTAVPHQIINENFTIKSLWFRLQLEKLRIPWITGSDTIVVRKDHVVKDSLNFINDCNMHKEIKIYFDGEKVQDAGGLLREWVHLITKELADKDTGILTRACCEQVYYTINTDLKLSLETLQKCKLLGKVLGKALFDRIPLNFSLSYPLLKHLLDKKVELEDLKTLDFQLYESWAFLQNIDLSTEILEQDFTYFDKTTQQVYELKPGGKEINVSQTNKSEFIELSVTKFIDKDLNFRQIFLEEFHKVIPLKFLQVFSLKELEMLLGGLKKISVEEWRANTEYKGSFHEKHRVILWFWDIMKTFNQEELSKMLLFCTGSSRIPLEGFRGLESNRGTLTKFCIESSKFLKENPYIKAHTCFNRLELPIYSSFEEVQTYMNCIINNNFEGVFGLD